MPQFKLPSSFSEDYNLWSFAQQFASDMVTEVKLTVRDWENAVQEQGNIKRRVFVAIISLRASSPIWAKEASRARTRKGAAKPRGAEEKWR